MRILLILLTAFIWSCSLSSNHHLPKSDLTSYDLIGRFGKEMNKRYGMCISATGGGSDKGIWLMTIYFDLYRPIRTKEEARRLIVDVTESFLARVNESQEIRPFLKSYPFTSKNLDISILAFESTNRKDTFYPNIDTVSIVEGKVEFDTRDPINTKRYLTTEFEPYEETLAIVRKEKENSM